MRKIRKPRRLNLGVVSLTAILFVIIATFVGFTTRKMVVTEATSSVRNLVKVCVGQIDALMLGVESAVNNSMWVVQEHLDDPSFMSRVTERLVRNNDFIVGSAVAYRSGKAPGHPQLYAPYCYNDATGGVCVTELLYDFDAQLPRNDWFHVPQKTGKSYWCEPYFDEGGGNIMMCTYSVPIKDKRGEIVAILTADISLADLSARVAKLRPYDGSYAVMKSALGKVLVPPPTDATHVFGEVLTIHGKAMNEWSVDLYCPTRTILQKAQQLVINIALFSIIGLGMIFFVSWIFSARLQRATAANERIESELSIAKTIQTSLTQVSFPAYAYAKMRPAKEVGGDRFDFVEKGDKAFFAVGDASGKGVPAALYTMLVGAGFSMAIDMNLEIADVVARVNRLVAEHNDSSMFVTGFAALWDRTNGLVRYCNAGHNPPIYISPEGKAEFVAVKRNLAMGVVDDYPYQAQTLSLPKGAKLIVYSDGVNEAMRRDGEQFGNERFLAFATVHAHTPVTETCNALFATIDHFVEGNEQSDDITVLVVEG